MSVSNTQKKNSRGREGREKEIEHRGEKVKFMCWWQRDEEEDEGEMWLTKKEKKKKKKKEKNRNRRIDFCAEMTHDWYN